MKNNVFISIVPSKLLLLLLPAIIAMCIGVFVEGAVLKWTTIIGYSSIFIFAIAATPYLFKAKAYSKLIGVWCVVILSMIPIFLIYLT